MEPFCRQSFCPCLSLSLAVGHLKPSFKWIILQFTSLSGRQCLTLTTDAENPSLAHSHPLLQLRHGHVCKVLPIRCSCPRFGINWELEVWRSRESPSWWWMVTAVFSETPGSMLQGWHSCSVPEAAMVSWLVLSHGLSCCQYSMFLSKPFFMAFLVILRATPALLSKILRCLNQSQVLFLFVF